MGFHMLEKELDGFQGFGGTAGRRSLGTVLEQKGKQLKQLSFDAQDPGRFIAAA